MPIDARDVVLDRGSVEPGFDDLAQARVVGQLLEFGEVQPRVFTHALALRFC